jgi:hypothetical protein
LIFEVLELELRAFTLSHSTSPSFVLEEQFAQVGFEPQFS